MTADDSTSSVEQGGPGAQVLAAFFLAHRPLPCSTDYPEVRASWYACTCREWASAKTRACIEAHHIIEFERHMVTALLADGWHRKSPASTPEEGL